MKSTSFKKVNQLVSDINAQITTSHEVTKKTVAPVTARDLAEKNLPTADEPSFEPYISQLKARYTTLKKNVELNVEGGIQKFLGILNGSYLTQKITEVKEKITAENNKIKNLMIDRNRCIIPWNYRIYKNLIWLLILFGISDSIWTSSSFLYLNDIVFVAIVIGIVLGLSQIFASKAAVLAIRQIQSARRRTKYYLIAIAGALIFSIILGLFRDNYIRENSDEIISFWSSNPFYFALINMVPIIATALLLHYFYPTKEQIEEIKKYEDIKEQIKHCDAAIKSLQREQKQLERERIEGLSLNEKLMHDETKLLEKVDAHYDESIGVFKHENILRRTDGLFPVCFKRAHESIPNPVTEHFNINHK